jgi:hypothetical protein
MVSEDIGFFKKIWYLTLVVVLGTTYFIWAVLVSLYQGLKKFLK